MTKVVITGVGPDQPGIVAGLTHVLEDLEANIEDSTMTLLAGEFAMILIVSIPSGLSLSAFQEAFRPVEQKLGIQLQVKPIEPDLPAHEPDASQTPLMISVAGHDRTGITAHVSEELARHQVNITDLNAQVIPGEEGPVYIMMIEVLLPAGMDQRQLESLLEPIARDLGVEIRCHPLESIAL